MNLTAETTDRLFAASLLAVITAVLWKWHPPVYHHDGFEYFLGGYLPLSNLRPHHLLWEPLNWLMIKLAQALRISPPSVLQIAGELFVALTGVIVFVEIRAIGIRRLPAYLLVLYAFLSPWIWALSSQNQPYPLLLLLTALIGTQTLSQEEDVPSHYRLLVCGILVALCVGLQQAAALWIPAIGGYLWLNRPKRDRLRLVALWLSATLVPVAVLYGWAATVWPISGLSELWQWSTAYAHTEHGIQLSLTSLLASTVGILRTFVQTRDLDSWLLDNNFTADSVAWLYGLTFLTLVGIVNFLRWRTILGAHPAPRLQRSLRLNLFLLGSWTLFCFLWEPSNYYWCVGLVPGALVLCILAVEWINANRLAFSGFLCGLLSWNVFANCKVDRYYGQGAPELIVPAITRFVDPQDRVLVIAKGRPHNVDYDLLRDLLITQRRSNIVFLLEDLILRSDVSWESKFDNLLKDTWKRGGRVYCSAELTRPKAYDILGDALHAYRVDKYRNIDPAVLYEKVRMKLIRYDATPPAFQLGEDKFFELRARASAQEGKDAARKSPR